MTTSTVETDRIQEFYERNGLIRPENGAYVVTASRQGHPDGLVLVEDPTTGVEYLDEGYKH
jgi:hypothetical protein